MLGDFVRRVRPKPAPEFELHFETAPGEQAQVDFAHFKVVFEDEPQQARIVWLFSLVLGHSRYLWARFVVHQDLQTVLRCHMAVFEHLQGVPRQILYDRMKTPLAAGSGRALRLQPSGLPGISCQDQGQGRAAVSLYPPGLLPRRALPQPGGFERAARALARHGGQRPRPRHHRAGRGRALHARAAELAGTSRRVLNATLKLERRISHEGMVSVGGNLYSVPERTRSRAVEVHTLVHEIRIFEAGRLIAVHALLEGRGQRSVLPGHRQFPRRAQQAASRAGALPLRRPGVGGTPPLGLL